MLNVLAKCNFLVPKLIEDHRSSNLLDAFKRGICNLLTVVGNSREFELTLSPLFFQIVLAPLGRGIVSDFPVTS